MEGIRNDRLTQALTGKQQEKSGETESKVEEPNSSSGIITGLIT
jgi:hypothetical protein